MSRTKTTDPDAILDAAAELFAGRPFHEVKLDDVASKARVGKGTLYLYWSSKEEVYLAIIRRGFAAVLDRVDVELARREGSPWERLASMIDALIDFAFTHPEVYRVMRSGIITPEDPDLQRLRAGLVQRIVRVIKEGVEAGTLDDPNPALTAQFVMSFVRGAILYPPAKMTRRSLRNHILHVLGSGIAKGGAR
ncbi:MAG TPA: TetR/AcrR family transcriptional regulator [Phycisphaerales bacterium]|nr:TetR/AcrR family transcriptional regulator [Phycisphaerales bacterium]